MGGHTQAVLPLAVSGDQDFPSATQPHVNDPRRAEGRDDKCALASGWWLVPAVVLGLAAWVGIIRTAWAWVL